MTTPPNPPAFPNPARGPYGTNGMSLRDWFAGQALPEAMRQGFGLSFRDVAEDAYAIADAMLAERARTTGEDTTA